MNTLINLILEYIPNVIFTDAELKIILFNASNDVRHSLIKRNIANGNIIRISRGLYCLNERFRKRPINQFEIAERLYSPSYISFESALSYHEWIPEAVYTVSSACTKRSKLISAPFGNYVFIKMPINSFFEEVELINQNNAYFFMASPYKAILDHILHYKKSYSSIYSLFIDLRIDEDYQNKETINKLVKTAQIFNNKYVSAFLERCLEKDEH